MANKEYYAERAKKRKLMGLCRQCPNPISSRSIVLCDKCLNDAKIRFSKKQYKQDRSRLDKTGLKYSSLKCNAAKREISFNLKRDEFCDWFNTIEKKCHYCGVSEQNLKSLNRKKSMITIDRKNNDVGYELDNLCIACFRCNNTKSNFFTELEWLNICKKYIVPRLNEYHRS